jgi:ribosome-associated translation inhibitor RaiA
MSDPGNSPAQLLAERMRLGAGFGDEDSGHVLELLAPLGRHLVRWSPENVDLELTVKNRGGSEQKVTLEAWLPGWPSLVATSADRDLDHALVKVRKDMIRQIDDQKEKHEPRKGRATRHRTA